MNNLKSKLNSLITKNQRNFIKYQISSIYYNMFKSYKNDKKILYMLVPEHGNLGDQAIAYASIKYLKEKFSDYKIIEITMNETYKYGKSLENIVSDDDIIFLHGGGNMGNHYIEEENARRHIIQKFKNNKIISFTQTMYFSNDEEGQRELNQSIDIYSQHKDLTIIARENKSYDMMKKYLKNNKIVKCPDIVFYLNNKLILDKKDKNDIMTCLRKDKETFISQDEKKELIENLKIKYKKVLVSDTKIENKVSKEEREQILLNLWNDFYNSKLVITDRLHGMIFCAITKTPCIVVRSLDHKIIESYKWIENLNYIKIVNNLEFKNIESIIEEMLNLNKIDEFDFDKKYFDVLRDENI